jgi:uncharacterized Zn-binding protein involved in type VI secretion
MFPIFSALVCARLKKTPAGLLGRVYRRAEKILDSFDFGLPPLYNRIGIAIMPTGPAARITDMHVCPMFTGPVPHVGGPIIGPGSPTVLIGGLPAAVLGDSCTCVGPPDSIILGSVTVLIGGKPAARMGDSCAHGGTIVVGFPTVIIGG